jgi:broad specificity phosphatase PhoE
MSEVLLTLVRHGRTVANATNLLQGHVDHPLDEVGIEQAAGLAAALTRVAPVTRLIASPLLRARQTADAIASGLGNSIVNVEVDPRWIELDYGDYDGVPIVDVPSATWGQWRNDIFFRPPNGESMAELDVRVRGALADLCGQNTDGHIVVVSHVSPIKAAVAWALGVDIGVSWRTALDRASMSTVRLDADRPALKSFNVTVHSRD